MFILKEFIPNGNVCIWTFLKAIVALILNGYLRNSKWNGRKEGNVLFNDALNTFYLPLYGVTHMV